MRQWTDKHGEDGLRAKFSVYKTKSREPYPMSHAHEYHPSDEVGADGEFVFVMRPETDEAAYHALLEYARAVQDRAPMLAADIRSRLRQIHCSRDRV